MLRRDNNKQEAHDAISQKDQSSRWLLRLWGNTVQRHRALSLILSVISLVLSDREDDDTESQSLSLLFIQITEQ